MLRKVLGGDETYTARRKHGKETMYGMECNGMQ